MNRFLKVCLCIVVGIVTLMLLFYFLAAVVGGFLVASSV